MVRRVIFIMIVASVTSFFVMWGCGSKTTRKASMMEKPKTGCNRCHGELSEILPPGHVAISPEEVKYCAMCHAGGGVLSPFEWIAHYRHYSATGFEGDCWSCHFVDDRERLGVIGAEEGDGLEINREKMVELTPYLHSWATSEHLDHRHAREKLTCGLCHTSFNLDEEFPMEKCLYCHGSYPDLAGLTKAIVPNPHESHLGEVNCNICHKIHQESENFCNQCHAFEYVFP